MCGFILAINAESRGQRSHPPRLESLRAEREDYMFPDEVDTPLHVAARLRFQRYRGLQSFRHSPWDPRENLPPDYARSAD